MMNFRYAEWIAAHYPTRASATAACQGASEDMKEMFPELLRVRGWCREREHWWCKTVEGEIIDPTVHQWYDAPEIMSEDYREFREGVDPEPIGKCMWCGVYVWDLKPIPEYRSEEKLSKDACGDECYDLLMEEFA